MRKYIRSTLTLVAALVFCFSQLQLTVSAISKPQKDVQTRGSKYFDEASCDTSSGGSGGGGGTVSTTGETTGPPKAVKKVLWDILTAAGTGIDETHAAAIMGSIDNEGAWHPMNVGYVPNNFDGKDPSVPKAVSEGYGLIGWTPGTNLTEDMGKLGLKDEKPYTAETQAKVIVGYLQPENKTGRYSKSDIDGFLNAKTLSEASKNWVGGDGWGFERPQVVNADELQQRLQSAKEILRQFKGSTGTVAATTTPGGGGSVCCSGSSSGGGSGGGSTTLTGNTNAEKIFNYLVDNADLTDKQAAGAVGSLMLESGGNTLNLDPTIVNSSSNAYGIAQWLPGTRLGGLEHYASEHGGDKSDLLMQAGYLVKEMKDGINAFELSDLKKQKSLSDAVKYWTDWFEGLAYSPDQQLYSERTDNAKTLLNSVNGGDPSTGDPTSSAPVTASGGCSCPDPAAGGDASGSLDSTLKDLANKNGGKTSITAQSIGGEPKGNANGDVQMPTRSSYKLYTAYATLRAIEAGKISWSTHVGAGSWSGSVLDTMEQMIVYSNNDAAESLRLNNKIGTPTQVTNMLQSDLGLSNKTVMGSGSASDPAGSNSRSTSNDFAKYLILLYNQKLKGVNKDSDYNKLIGFMKRATTDGGSARDGIVAGVGAGTDVADKPGWAPAGVDPASNDVGIVYLDKSPYVLAILTDKPDQWDGVASIAKAVNASMGGSSSGGCSGAVAGDLQATVKNYAWPDYHSAPYVKMEPDYAAAVKQAQADGRYVGGNSYPGVDCGGFVTTAMIDSQFEPGYNSNGKGGFTGSAGDPNTQWGWLDKNWQKINPSSTKDLQPGDVAINSSHTYMYVGKIPGFNSVVASASLDTRAPMAGQEAPADPGFTWYRKK